LARITLYTKQINDHGFDVSQHECEDVREWVLENIPDGVPFKVFKGQICGANDVTENPAGDGDFSIVESPGAAFVPYIIMAVVAIATYLLMPTVPSMSYNQQAESANNSLTNRNNEPRPYKRVYDVCGQVQVIPSDIMLAYRKFTGGTEYEYGYYYVGRDYIACKDFLDGDTLIEYITGSAVSVYHPYTKPGNGSPVYNVGGDISEGIYTVYRSNEVDGAVLKAPNEITIEMPNTATASYVTTNRGRFTDLTGDSDFSGKLSVGVSVKVTGVKVLGPLISTGPSTSIQTYTELNGTYTVLDVIETEVLLDVSSNNTAWSIIKDGSQVISDGDPKIEPSDSVEQSYSDWVTLSRIPPKEIWANIVARQGLYKDNGQNRISASVQAELQYQYLDASGAPVGSIYSVTGTITGDDSDEKGITIEAVLGSETAVRVRARRITPKDFKYNGTVVDEIVFRDLYGAIPDDTTDYGNFTTIHSKRKRTPRATSVKQPQLKLTGTELVFKYLGGGVFDTVRTENTQAVQSLIRLLRDPAVGNLTLTSANMDRLLSSQAEVETYFGTEYAGQFCYTFDDYKTTAQAIISTIANAIFCSAYRTGHAIDLYFERPQLGPSRIFTSRSKIPGNEKWTTKFIDRERYDSVEYTWTNPKTNVKETIKIPEDGGSNTETIDGIGVRNYQQANWAAWRAFNKNIYRTTWVDVTTTADGKFVKPWQAIGVVKGSRVAPYDGYVVAVNGLKLTLSQPVAFIDGDDHYIQIKRRDGTVEAVRVLPGASKREVIMVSTPAEEIYTGNSALKTEFSFGAEQRHKAHMIIPATIEPDSNGDTVQITGYNYSDMYYANDGVDPFADAFDDGFDDGFS